MFLGVLLSIERALFDCYEAKVVCKTKFEKKLVHRQNEHFSLEICHEVTRHGQVANH